MCKHYIGNVHTMCAGAYNIHQQGKRMNKLVVGVETSWNAELGSQNPVEEKSGKVVAMKVEHVVPNQTVAHRGVPLLMLHHGNLPRGKYSGRDSARCKMWMWSH